MQERRYRPGDVLDDYCPRERRITDHAVVATVDDEIRRTRCVSCDAEHEYKAGKVPAPRRKTQPPALFAQVLEGLQGPAARLQSPPPPASEGAPSPPGESLLATPAESAGAGAAEPPGPAALSQADAESPQAEREEGPVRRPLIRAQFPRIEGQPPTPRAMPEFTLQTLHNRARHGGGAQRGGGHLRPHQRRHAGGGVDPFTGPMRFGRDNGHGGPGDGQRPPGQGPGRRRRRGGKKNR